MKQVIVLSFFFCALLFSESNANIFNKNNSNVYELQASQDTLNSLLNKVKYFAKRKEYDSAIVCSKKLFSHSALIPDSLFMARASRRLGFYFRRKNEVDSSFIYFNKSLAISLKLKDSVQSSMRFLDIANIQSRLGDFSGCMATATDGLNYLTDDSGSNVSTGLYHIISISAREQSDFIEALKWNKRALELSKNENNKIIFLNTKANILAGQKDYSQSIPILRRLLEDTLVTKNPYELSRIQSNLGHILFLQLGQNSESEKLLVSALKKREELNTASGLIASNIHLANYYKATDAIKTLAFAQDALKNAEILGNQVAILEALDIIVLIKTELGIAVGKEAVQYSQVQNKLERIRQNIRRIYASTKYDNDKLSRDNLILKAETSKKETQNTIYLSALLLAIALIGFVAYYKNNQRKKAKLKASYKTELRLAKKIHDEVGNDIFYLMTQMENVSRETEGKVVKKFLKPLNQIHLKVRDINKEHGPVNTGTAYMSQLLEMMNSYQTEEVRIVTNEISEDFWRSVSSHKKTELFLVLRELLTNMKRHSKTTFVGINFSKERNKIKIKYTENDTSFDIKKLVKGNGLINVENRMNSIGGTIKFDSPPNLGMTIEIQFFK